MVANAKPDRQSSRRGWAVRALVAVTLLVALTVSLGASPAGAVVARIGGHSYGITPRRGVPARSVAGAVSPGPAAAAVRPYDEAPFGGAPLEYHGGAVMHSNTTHVIYWDPEKEFTSTTKGIVNGFFTDVAHDSGKPTNVFAVDAQYEDFSSHAAYSSTSAAPLTDTDAYPTSGCTVPKKDDLGPPYTHCLTDKQLQEELKSFIEAEGLPRGSTQLYFLLLPHKVDTCYTGEECSNDVYCAYHSYINGTSETEIIYANIPFSLLDSEWAKGCQADNLEELQLPNGDAEGTNSSTRFADVAIKFISHEYSEAITDPRLNAWYDEVGEENGDKCNAYPFRAELEGKPGYDKHAFTPTLGGSAEEGTLFNQSIDEAHFYLQSEWDNAAAECLMKPLAPRFTGLGQGAAVAGSPTSFTAQVEDPYGAEAAVAWEFGDGASASGANTSHVYAAAGAYKVRVTATDPLTNSVATSEHELVVSPPPPPAEGLPPPTKATASTTTTSTTGSQGGPAATSAFTGGVSFNAGTGAITASITVSNPGSLSWLGTFPNGKFGAFASAARCKRNQIRLRGHCRPAKIVFAKGSESVAGSGAVTVVLKPSSSALKALRNALRHHKGVPVTLTLTFKSSRGAGPVSQTLHVVVKLRKR